MDKFQDYEEGKNFKFNVKQELQGNIELKLLVVCKLILD